MFRFFNRNKFTNHIPKQNNVLLIETNGCHGEVISAYIKYFEQLNFNVYVLASNVIKKENPFCRLNIKNLFYSKFKNFAKILKSEYLNRYDHIFVMSSVNYTFGEKPVTELYPDLQQHKSVFYVHHNMAYIEKYFQNTDKSHNIMLGQFPDTVYLNPHLFGEYTIPSKSEPTIFVSVGGINPRRKNHTMLLNAIEELHDKNYNFQILVVGSGSIKNLNNKIKQHLKILGHLNYDKMYDAVEHAHFFLPLLDENNPDHERYIKTQVTGSAQLIYGFTKIPVIHKQFAKFYRFDTKNSVPYENLAAGMEQAILMSESDYDNHIFELKKTATGIKLESLKNLAKILNI